MVKNVDARLRRAAVMIGLCAALTGRALAAESLIPVGEAVGIRLEVEGVLVAGTGTVETPDGPASPAQDAGIRAGDVITALDGVPVERAEELAEELARLDGSGAELTVERGGREMHVAVAPVPSAEGDGQRLGLWLRDGVTGIGTLTYIDPETGSFGALGHCVSDAGGGAPLAVEDGGVSAAQIVDVTPGSPGVPGELSGSFRTGEELGVIEKNTGSGIFGTMLRPMDGRRAAVPVASPDEVKNGEATILACVAGEEAREYRVEIARTGFMTGTGRDLTVRVTDPELLARTGGIVQGMSGSPILQNGRLVGAVTHVLTADPTRGYGIFAETMLRAAEAA